MLSVSEQPRCTQGQSQNTIRRLARFRMAFAFRFPKIRSIRSGARACWNLGSQIERGAITASLGKGELAESSNSNQISRLRRKLGIQTLRGANATAQTPRQPVRQRSACSHLPAARLESSLESQVLPPGCSSGSLGRITGNRCWLPGSDGARLPETGKPSTPDYPGTPDYPCLGNRRPSCTVMAPSWASRRASNSEIP